MPIYLAAFLIGVICGLRSLTGPAAVTWAAKLGWIHLEGSFLAFLAHPYAAYIASVFAAGELVADKLPKTPSRKAPAPFIGRIVLGGLCGAALGANAHVLEIGAVLGAFGGVAGTLGGAELRSRLVKAIGGKDFPIAVLEDVIALGGAFLIVSHV